MRKIMIIDDNPIQTFILSESIKRRGFEIIEIDDGSNALELVKKYQPDLIILDIVMPNKSGYDILKEIKDIPVMVVSSLENEEAIKKAYNLGAKYYISKPFDVQFMKNIIEEELAYIS